MDWNLSCPDWETRLREGRSLVPALPLFKSEADLAIEIFNDLHLPDVPGLPTLKDAGGEWFRDIVRALFGSFDPATGIRHVRENFTLVPKKNSKTTNGAALMVTALIMNKRPRAEFLLIGPTQAISELAFNQAVGMIQADPDLKDRFHIQEHLKQITFRPSKAKLKIKTFDTKVLTGVKPAGALVDELHEIASSPDADRVIGQLRGGLLPNPEGFLVFITTQSERPPQGVFRAELNKARAIRDGLIPGAMLPVLYEFPEAIVKNGEWRESKIWHWVTPNRGRSVEISRLIEDFEGAKVAGEDELRRWASQHLNIEIGLALRSDRWAGADHWEKRGDRSINIDSMIARCDAITIGIDGGGLDDLLGFSALGRDKETREWLHWGHAWCTSGVLERRKDIAARLRDFERDGDLTIIETPGQDVIEVADLVELVFNSGLLPEKNAIGVDPVGIGEIVDEIAARGIESERIVGIPQGWKLNGAIITSERKLANGTLKHAGQRLMAWCAGNAKVEPKGSAKSITKQAAGSAKIDPLMAKFNSIALMSMNPEGSGKSFWEDDDYVAGAKTDSISIQSAETV